MDFVIFTTMKEEQKIYRKLYNRYGPVLSPFGLSKKQILNEDHIVSSLCIDNCDFVIVCDMFTDGIQKMVIAPDIIIGANNTYEVVVNKNSNVILRTLEDYKPYNIDEYDKICKQIDYILYRKKELEIERKMKRIEEDF